MADKHPHLGANLSFNFADIFKGINDVPGLFSSLKDSRIKEEFLKNVQLFVPNWADIFIQLFPRILNASMIDQLEKEGYGEKLTAMTANCFEYFKDRREAVIWLFKNAGKKRKDWYIAANISQERQIIVLIRILDLTFRDIDNQKDTVEARRINKQAHTVLFKEGTLGSFIGDADFETVTRIYTLINDVKNLELQDKMNIKVKIQDRFPEFKFLDSEEKRVSKRLTVTKPKYEEMRQEYTRIMDVEVPANSKEIGAARLHGDLKENAEYIAAKEKQAHLNARAEKLKEDIDRAQLFDPQFIDTSRVSFGTIVVLQNDTKSRREEFTILGPCESDPTNNIISYETEFGKAMVGLTPGEKLSLVSDGEKISYTVENIRAAEF
jgi:transcription elongation factor GreA